MKLAKSLLLGSAAGLVAVTGAQAADLPVRAAAPVDYVRTCPNAPIGGTGFFVIPGTETCLQISGYVRTEYRFSEGANYEVQAPGSRVGTVAGEAVLLNPDVPTGIAANSREQDNISFFARGSIAFDARTPTEYGTLRSFIRINADRVDGAGTAVLDQGYIQFAGLTAGRITSFFSFWGGNLMSANSGVTDPSVELLAYTATFGSGFSATVSVENGRARRTSVTGTSNDFGIADYGGQQLPDLVANLNVSQAWGSAQVMAALHQLRHDNNTAAAALVDDEMGWAIGAGLNIRLPMIAAGDALWLQAVYTNGALQYAGAPTSTSDFTLRTRDGLVNAAVNGIRTTEAWSIAAGFRHYWAPTFWQDIQGSYGVVDQPQNAALVGAQLPTAGLDYSWWSAGTRINWRPVGGLTFSADVVYTNIDADNRVILLGTAAAPTLTSSDGSQWAGRLRIQRDF